MNAWIQMTSGRGPDECCLAIAELMAVFQRDSKRVGLKVDLLEYAKGHRPDTYKSILLSVRGERTEEFSKGWEGVVQWIMRSPYRANCGRKNWFVGVNVFLPTQQHERFSNREMKFEALRASGPGGQHVNKTSSAIRATHVKTGLSVFAQEERSQALNKKLATARLLRLVAVQAQEARDAMQQTIWSQHSNLERGNPIRIYEGRPMRLKKRN